MPTKPSAAAKVPSGWTVVEVDEDFDDDGYEATHEEPDDDGAR